MRDNFPVMMGIAKGVEDRHYGQISKNRRFARNWSLAFTGKFQNSTFCP